MHISLDQEKKNSTEPGSLSGIVDALRRDAVKNFLFLMEVRDGKVKDEDLRVRMSAAKELSSSLYKYQAKFHARQNGIKIEVVDATSAPVQLPGEIKQ